MSTDRVCGSSNNSKMDKKKKHLQEYYLPEEMISSFPHLQSSSENTIGDRSTETARYGEMLLVDYEN